MNIADYVTITQISSENNYQHAVDGIGFVIPGENFLASISPGEPIQYVALLRYTEGVARANHYHKLKREHLIVLEGVLECEFYMPANIDERTVIEVEAGKMITIQPGCGHTFTALTPGATVLELSPQKLDLSDQISLL